MEPLPHRAEDVRSSPLWMQGDNPVPRVDHSMEIWNDRGARQLDPGADASLLVPRCACLGWNDPLDARMVHISWGCQRELDRYKQAPPRAAP